MAGLALDPEVLEVLFVGDAQCRGIGLVVAGHALDLEIGGVHRVRKVDGPRGGRAGDDLGQLRAWLRRLPRGRQCHHESGQDDG